jgi:predicted nucleotidyltransferase
MKAEAVMTNSLDFHVSAAQLRELCRRFQVKDLSVFGSAARGEMRPDSDVDILVEFEAGHSNGLFEFDELERELAALFGRKVDLVSKRGLKPRVRGSVLHDARPIYAA